MGVSTISLVDSFAEAALDGRLWHASLEKFADATGSARGQLIGIGDAKTTMFNIITSSSAYEHSRFAELASYDPKVNFRVAASRVSPLMATVSDRHYAQVIPSLVSDAYMEYCHEADMMFGCQATLIQEPEGLIGLSMLRSRNDGRVSEEQLETFEAVAPHVRSAVRVQQLLEEDAERLMLGTMDTINVAAFVYDKHGCVKHYSMSAEGILKYGRLISHNGRLKSRNSSECEVLDRSLKKAISARPGSVISCALIDERDPMVIDLISVPPRHWNISFEPSVLLVIRCRDSSTVASAAILKATYDLSDAEAHVAVGLARGRSRDQIAQDRGVSTHTIRVQIKALFWKMDVNRETLLATMAAKFL